MYSKTVEGKAMTLKLTEVPGSQVQGLLLGQDSPQCQYRWGMNGSSAALLRRTWGSSVHFISVKSCTFL